MTRYPKQLLALPLLLWSWNTMAWQAQDTLTAAYLKDYSCTFAIEKRQLSGPGADLIRKNITGVQFVTLGELHQSATLADLTTVLLDELSREGFHHFAVETGPVAAKELMDFSNPPEATAAALRIINRKYGSMQPGRYPFMFFQGIEDARFLQSASEHRYDIWGLDQEFAGSYLFWMDKLRDLIEVENQSTLALYHAARRYIEELYVKSQSDAQYKVNDSLMHKQEIAQFFNTFRAGNKPAQEIIDALKSTWNIYSLYETGHYAENNRRRSEYMKNNFINCYGEALASGEKSPRVFVKLGSVHTSKGKSPLGINDIGRFVDSLAMQNNTRVTSFRHLRRYYYERDQVVDYLTSGESWVNNYQPFLERGNKDTWIIIDLKSLRTRLVEKTLKANKDAAYEIMNYDFMLISPADRKVTPNF